MATWLCSSNSRSSRERHLPFVIASAVPGAAFVRVGTGSQGSTPSLPAVSWSCFKFLGMAPSPQKKTTLPPFSKNRSNVPAD